MGAISGGWRRWLGRRRWTGLDALRARYDVFRHLLEGNNRVLEAIADAGEKSGGDHLFDRRYLESLVDLLERAVSGVVFDLNAMTAGRHFELVDAFEGIRQEIRDVLAPGAGMKSDLVLSFERVDLDLVEAVGEKMGMLGELRRSLRLPVPEGFVLSASGCRRQFKKGGLRDKIVAHAREIQDRIGGSLEGTAETLQTLVRCAPIDRAIARALRHELKRGKRSGWTYAVRSSAVGEGGVHSFAGQHLTLLNVPAAGVTGAYREVLASLFSTQALRYRIENGLSIENALMAVGFLRMVPARASGVIHTSDPVGHAHDMMVVSAVLGLGPMVAQGIGTADRFELSREPSPRVLSRRIARKESSLVSLDKGGTRMMAVREAIRESASVSDEELVELGRMALRIERYAGQRQEIEFAVTPDGRPVILQTRALSSSPTRVYEKTEAAALSRQLARCKVLLRDKGVIACRGLGTGPVVAVNSSADLGGFPAGGILVARNASPRYSSVLPLASAVVTTLGTSTGHLATVAREYRVPMLVDVQGATDVLRAGMDITVDAEQNVVYEGVVEELVRFHLSQQPREVKFEEFRLLRRLLRRISPLNLANPDAENFSARSCRTYHDIIRFAHEMAVRDLVEMPGLRAHERKRLVRRLRLEVPLDLDLIDIGGGLAPGAEESCVEPSAVDCQPLAAILQGLTAPGAWRTEPAAIDMGSLLASATSVMAPAVVGAGRVRSNLAIITRDYLNLHLFLGYHFNIIDCHLSENANANYIDFRFHGGATDVTRRSRRARVLALILEEHEFAVETKGDLVIGRLGGIGMDRMRERLEMIGRLIGYCRQLDVLMRDEAAVWACVREFLNGRGGIMNSPSSSGEGAGLEGSHREAQMEGTRVMVVDDEQIVCDRLKDHLEKDGFQVDTFVKSTAALAALEERSYDVLVTDLKMAEASGQDVLLQVRRRGYPTQVIMISAYASMDAVRDAEFVGAYDFLCKPFEMKTLSKLVKKAARRARRAQAKS